MEASWAKAATGTQRAAAEHSSTARRCEAVRGEDCSVAGMQCSFNVLVALVRSALSRWAVNYAIGNRGGAKCRAARAQHVNRDPDSHFAGENARALGRAVLPVSPDSLPARPAGFSAVAASRVAPFRRWLTRPGSPTNPPSGRSFHHFHHVHHSFSSTSLHNPIVAPSKPGCDPLPPQSSARLPVRFDPPAVAATLTALPRHGCLRRPAVA